MSATDIKQSPLMSVGPQTSDSQHSRIPNVAKTSSRSDTLTWPSSLTSSIHHVVAEVPSDPSGSLSSPPMLQLGSGAHVTSAAGLAPPGTDGVSSPIVEAPSAAQQLQTCAPLPTASSPPVRVQSTGPPLDPLRRRVRVGGGGGAACVHTQVDPLPCLAIVCVAPTMESSVAVPGVLPSHHCGVHCTPASLVRNAERRRLYDRKPACASAIAVRRAVRRVPPDASSITVSWASIAASCASTAAATSSLPSHTDVSSMRSRNAAANSQW